jgi:hypothetical protein
MRRTGLPVRTWGEEIKGWGVLGGAGGFKQVVFCSYSRLPVAGTGFKPFPAMYRGLNVPQSIQNLAIICYNREK